jgi:hypothetical protein
MTVSDIMFQKLCFVLHRGFLEVRSLALTNSREQLFDLADTLEELPGLLPAWSDEHLPLLRRLLERYEKKYQGRASEFLSILDMDDAMFRNLFSTEGIAAQPRNE